MSTAPAKEAVGGPERDRNSGGSSRGLALWSGITLVVAQVLLVVHAWGRWAAVGALCTLFALRFGLNTFIFSRAKRLGRMGRVETCVVLLGNMAASTAESQLMRWNLMGWLTVLLQAVFLNAFPSRDALTERRVGLGLYLAVSAGLGLRAGVEPGTVGLFCLAACAFYGLGEARCLLLSDALEASRESHRRLQRMQRELVTHEKLSSLGLLAAGVAHEINNPMAFVTSNVRSLSRDLAAQEELPEELREYVNDVLPATLDGIRRVNAIVADLKRFARNDPEEPVEFDLNAEVSSALRLSQGERRGRCQVELELGELPPVMGQPRQIGQVVLNLLVNAVQAVPGQGGVVKVRTRAEEEEVVVEVRDNGVGMSKEVLGQLFQPFFTTKPVGEGTGLGLAVAYGIITGHGGRIAVESELGRGTCFTVRLPVAAEERVTTPLPPGEGRGEGLPAHGLSPREAPSPAGRGLG
ncbi:sensor histidine kinase [Archangium lansingense]|uniref:sensor histidine kinase n=1 Tax=Archangium lansingense TaxID=2995310 RepID=UPI003B7AE32A